MIIIKQQRKISISFKELPLAGRKLSIKNLFQTNLDYAAENFAFSLPPSSFQLPLA